MKTGWPVDNSEDFDDGTDMEALMQQASDQLAASRKGLKRPAKTGKQPLENKTPKRRQPARPVPVAPAAPSAAAAAPTASAVAPAEFAPALTAESGSAKFKQAILRHLTYTLARDTTTAQPRDWWLATAMAVREAVLARLIATQRLHNQSNARRLYYLSLEYLMGRLMENNLSNTGLLEPARQALQELGVDFEALLEQEVDMGLGNGGLGRLAACFLDSLATLDLPAIGYGIHYEFGLFRQEFVNGHQVEHPDAWMIFGTPWEVIRPDYAIEVRVYGEVENVFDDRGHYRPRLGAEPRDPRRALRHSDRRLRHQDGELPPPLGVAVHGGVRPRGLQLRRLRRGGA